MGGANDPASRRPGPVSSVDPASSVAPTPAVDPAFARSARRWLLAYPRRWRLARADEVVGTLADLAAPGATRLPWRDGLGLVVHGLATRRRMLPPLRVRLRYRLGLGRVPWQYRGWLADELAGPVFGWRRQAFPVVAMTGAIANGVLGGSAYPTAFVWLLCFCAGVLLVPATRAQRDVARRQLVPAPGDSPTPWDQKSGWVYRDRLAARALLVPMAWAAVAVTVSAVLRMAADGSALTAVHAGFLALGALVTLRLVVRWHRRVPGRPDQPHRRLVAPRWRHHAAVWLFAATGAFLAWPELTPFGRLDEDLHLAAPLLLGLALVVLPTAVAGAVLAAHGPVDLAATDVWRLVVGRGPLRVETLVTGVVPAWFDSARRSPLTESVPADPSPA